MPDYDFRSLSPIDFEILSRDLLQKELGITLESFKPGRDLGIDFRFWPTQDHKLIVQCKHYLDSGFDSLLRKLTKEELPKIRKLAPTRYILTTSVPLSPSQRDQIKSALSPFIRSSGDILGKDDLNNLLAKFPAIESQTVKLWFSSVNVMEEMFYSKIKNLSRDEIEHIKEHAKIYVHNESFAEALAILEEFHFCIISGIPGIGKTILAEMLLLRYSKEAAYEIVKISEDISDAWSLGISSEKKIFYYDDFLGQTSFAEKFRKNEDQRLVQFIDAVRRSKGARLVLTTREYILNQACHQYEVIACELLEPQKCIVDLSKYTRIIRAKILFNHLYFSELDNSYSKAILADRNYLKIIDHKNYNPRIIQLMTEVVRTRDIGPDIYLRFFLQNLNNPLAVWSHAFEKHLSQSGRNLLIVLMSTPYAVFMSDLRPAFQQYSSVYSERYRTSMSPQDFQFALREIGGSLLDLQ